ncbi:SpoVR family protein [Eisenibacter elegans]|uniref:SpoVR family protein n=1 Tax=Eisenibacter elegans TaxID=997 RepID=UPI00040B3748|nr:SpoVR family protein [Eisenibacter elegans]
MHLIDQHTKGIMEECKARAKDAGLRFDDDSLEYIVTNKDMIELSPKVMIPTLYDYWVNDVEVLKEIGKYKLYPNNPYETVINSRPAISFYNDNNPDWMNIMIFYHVLAHIDFFQNNRMFEHTWGDDFVGQALADKRLIANLRSEHGRWVDYAIEFSRGINNLNGYYRELYRRNFPQDNEPPTRVGFYFGKFLQDIEKISDTQYYKEVERYNELIGIHGEDLAESIFFEDLKTKYPEFQTKYSSHLKKLEDAVESVDLIEFIRDNSPFLRKEANRWIKLVMSIVRNTAVYFEPQIRTKIINEGWASYWHDTLFLQDDRIKGHEVSYARLNAGVTALQRGGLNPYAIGLRLMQYVEDLGDKGKLQYQFQQMAGIDARANYDGKVQNGRKAIFDLRTHFSDFTLIKTFVDQDFVDEHDLFVLGQRLDPQRQVYQYYVKSRRAEDYQQMLINSLYHPPAMQVDVERTHDKCLYIKHLFEGKPLIPDFIADTMLGIEYLWGAPVKLDTFDVVASRDEDAPPEVTPVRYTMKNRQLSKEVLN